MEVLPEFLSVEPRVDEAAFIAPGAWVIGDVDIAEGASVWFGAVVRGDVQQIVIGLIIIVSVAVSILRSRRA